MSELPFSSGVYSVAPGLRRLIGPATSIDGFSRYRSEKRAAASSRAVYLEHELPSLIHEEAVRYLAQLLVREHPDVFTLESGTLRSSLSEDVVALNDDALRTMPFLMTEDVAVMRVTADREYLAAGHICLPSSWRLEDKIGKPFAEVHAPVPGIALQSASAMVRSLATRGPYERYAWGLTNVDVLDQQAGVHAEVQPHPLYVRIERQTIHPLPHCGAWLFLIHPSNTRADTLSHAQKLQLAAALESMTPAQAVYKGIAATRRSIIDALRSNAPQERR